jgi:hypothetical protein
MKFVSTFSCTPYLSLKLESGSEWSLLTFERSIREIVTYHLDGIFGSLHTQQLHVFDELRNNQRIIQNRSAKIKTIVASLYLPASPFIFRFLRLAQKMERKEMAKNIILTVRMEVKFDQNKGFPQPTSKIWTSHTHRISSRVNFMSASQDFLFWIKCPEMVLWKTVISYFGNKKRPGLRVSGVSN